MGLHLLACSARALRHKSARIAVFADRRPRDDKKRPATQRNLENEKLISIVERHRKERNRESEKKKNRLPLFTRNPTKDSKGRFSRKSSIGRV